MFRADNTTWEPASAKATAQPKPTPDEAPVISAFIPSNLIDGVLGNLITLLLVHRGHFHHHNA